MPAIDSILAAAVKDANAYTAIVTPVKISRPKSMPFPTSTQYINSILPQEYEN
jgi:hypothetical protein